jgi:hypothetical protein
MFNFILKNHKIDLIGYVSYFGVPPPPPPESAGELRFISLRKISSRGKNPRVQHS